jgi:hypothetical protein
VVFHSFDMENQVYIWGQILQMNCIQNIKTGFSQEESCLYCVNKNFVYSITINKIKLMSKNINDNEV